VLKEIFDLLLTLIFPPYCAGCQKLGTFLCGKCYDRLEFKALPIRTKLKPSYIDSITASVNYSSAIPKLLHLMKYKNVKGIATFCGEFLFTTTYYPDAEIVTSVPIHPRRKRERGFNQSEVMAKEFALQAGITYRQMLVKTKYSQPQAKAKSKQQRLHNLDQTFAAHPLFKKFATRTPTSALLIDDVCTTGTTLNQCAKVLKEIGVLQVHGLVVAHGK
jgi:ComF family protein